MIISFISSIRIDIGLSGPNSWPLPIAIFGVWCRRQRSMVTSTPVIWHFSRKMSRTICFTTFFLYWNFRTGTKTWLEQWKPWKKQFDERIFPGFLSLFWVVFKGVPFCDDHWGRRRFLQDFQEKMVRIWTNCYQKCHFQVVDFVINVLLSDAAAYDSFGGNGSR